MMRSLFDDVSAESEEEQQQSRPSSPTPSDWEQLDSEDESEPPPLKPSPVNGRHGQTTVSTPAPVQAGKARGVVLTLLCPKASKTAEPSGLQSTLVEATDYGFDSDCIATDMFADQHYRIASWMCEQYHSKDSSKAKHFHPSQGPFVLEYDEDNDKCVIYSTRMAPTCLISHQKSQRLLFRLTVPSWRRHQAPP